MGDAIKSFIKSTSLQRTQIIEIPQLIKLNLDEFIWSLDELEDVEKEICAFLNTVADDLLKIDK